MDLTPLLPGGENGGAKVFILELLHAMVSLAPDKCFLLLTQHSTHEELASLDGDNVRRECVLGPAARSRPGVFKLASTILAWLPRGARRQLASRAYRMHSRMKRAAAGDLLKREAVDLLFCPFTAPAFHHPGLPTVCTVYDVQSQRFPEFFGVEESSYRDAAFFDACTRATALAAISSFTRSEVIELGFVAAERVTTIPIQVTAPGVRPASTAALEAAGVEPGRYLLYPANFWPHKNHARLFEAFALAHGAGLALDLKLVCTGAPGARLETARVAARNAGIETAVVFPGFVAPAVLDQWMWSARGLVFPSLHEGFGMPLVEAMARGIPVACSRTAALPEVAGEAALLFDPANADAIAASLVALEAGGPDRERRVAAGLERARAFTDPARMAREYLALFDRCV